MAHIKISRRRGTKIVVFSLRLFCFSPDFLQLHTPDTKGVSVTFWVGSEYCGCIFNRSSPKTNGFLTAEGGIKGASEMGLQLRKLKKPAIQGFSQ
jgi:hypothetical protein